jgi:aminopeptidase N
MVKKSIFTLLLPVLSFLGCLGAVNTPLDNNNLDVIHVTLDLQFDWDHQQAYGTAGITFKVAAASKTIALDAGFLNIEKVSLENGETVTFSYDGGDQPKGLTIQHPQTFSAGKLYTIFIQYRTTHKNISDPYSLGGSNGKGLRFFSPTATEPRKRKQIWSMSEYQSNRYWFPCNDVLNDLRSTTITLTVEQPLTAISNGTLISTKKQTNGDITYKWKLEQAYANYQTAIVIGAYTDITSVYNQTTIHNYAYPDEVDAVTASVARLKDMFSFFESYTGVTYPFKNYNQVFVQDLPWGMSSAATSVQTENMVDDYGTHADYFYLWDGLEAEALAQQWFGVLLSPASWSDNWLNKGMSRYFDQLFSEYKNGTDEMVLWNHLYDLNIYLGDWYNNYRHPIVTNEYPSEFTYVTDNYAYMRGAMVAHMLRKQVGETAWKQGLQALIAENKGKPITTGMLQSAMEKSCGTSLSTFFNQWLYAIGHPVFEVTQQYDATNKLITVTLNQIQEKDTTTSYPQVDYFEGNMDIQIDGKLYNVFIAAKKENRFIFPQNTAPQLLHIDYQSTWIKELVFEKSLTELIYQFENDQDVLGRQWAMGEIVNFYNDSTTTAEQKASIITSFNKVIQQNIYWRMRFNVLNQLRNLTPAPFSPQTINVLQNIIKNESSWMRFAAINMLGNSKDSSFAELYIYYLNDSSDRVVNAAAIALGKSGSSKAVSALLQLPNKPSWKNQTLISALNGLRELGQASGIPLALKALQDEPAGARWTLATPIWDYRMAAANTLVTLGAADKGYDIVHARFIKSLADNDVNDIFSNILLINILGDTRGSEAYALLKNHVADDTALLEAANYYESLFNSTIQK